MKRRAAWWWIDRWRKSTAYTDMPLEQQGAYRNLLDELWLRDGVLPNDDRILAKVCGDALAWSKVRDAVMARFYLTSEGWRNSTHDEVVAGSKFFKSQSDKGKRGAEARWGQHKEDGPANGPAISPANSRGNSPADGQTMAFRTPSPYSVLRTPSPDPTDDSVGTIVVGDEPTADDGSNAYVTAVLRLYLQLPGTRERATAKDRLTAARLYRDGYSIDCVRAGLLTATARRELRNREQPLPPIGSLAYFLDAIKEARASPPEPGYVEHLAGKIHDRLKGAMEESDVEA